MTRLRAMLNKVYRHCSCAEAALRDLKENVAEARQSDDQKLRRRSAGTAHGCGRGGRARSWTQIEHLLAETGDRP